MPTRPFLVLRNQTCVPLEGPYRVECHEERWFVLGHNEAHAVRSEAEAWHLLERMRDDEEAHRLANEALEALGGLDREFDVSSIQS
jgi:hypothetical protein